MGDIILQSESDFSVRVSTHTMTVKAGQSISIPVMVGKVKGGSRLIQLTASDWKAAGLSADIQPPAVPSGGGALLSITIPPGTAPGSYLFTVRGSTEGTFKTSNDTITVTVEPETEDREGEDRGNAQQGDALPGTEAGPAVAASPAAAKRASLFRSAKKAPPRPLSAGQRALFLVIMFVMVGVLIYYVSNLLSDNLTSSPGSASGTMAGTYTGTSTFCIKSVMGNAPECGTSNASIQIDASGNVLGPGLFGKISGSSFTGEARPGDGTTFPMTGTFSNGTLNARHESSSVTWTITVHN